MDGRMHYDVQTRQHDNSHESGKTLKPWQQITCSGEDSDKPATPGAIHWGWAAAAGVLVSITLALLLAYDIRTQRRLITVTVEQSSSTKPPAPGPPPPGPDTLSVEEVRQQGQLNARPSLLAHERRPFVGLWPAVPDNTVLSSKASGSQAAAAAAGSSAGVSEAAPPEFDHSAYMDYNPHLAHSLGAGHDLGQLPTGAAAWLQYKELLQLQRQAKGSSSGSSSRSSKTGSTAPAGGVYCRRIPVVLSYATGEMGLCNQVYTHIAAWALAAQLGADVLVPPAVKRESFAAYGGYETTPFEGLFSWPHTQELLQGLGVQARLYPSLETGTRQLFADAAAFLRQELASRPPPLPRLPPQQQQQQRQHITSAAAATQIRRLAAAAPAGRATAAPAGRATTAPAGRATTAPAGRAAPKPQGHAGAVPLSVAPERPQTSDVMLHPGQLQKLIAAAAATSAGRALPVHPTAPAPRPLVPLPSLPTPAPQEPRPKPQQSTATPAAAAAAAAPERKSTSAGPAPHPPPAGHQKAGVQAVKDGEGPQPQLAQLLRLSGQRDTLLPLIMFKAQHLHELQGLAVAAVLQAVANASAVAPPAAVPTPRATKGATSRNSRSNSRRHSRSSHGSRSSNGGRSSSGGGGSSNAKTTADGGTPGALLPCAAVPLVHLHLMKPLFVLHTRGDALAAHIASRLRFAAPVEQRADEVLQAMAARNMTRYHGIHLRVEGDQPYTEAMGGLKGVLQLYLQAAARIGLGAPGAERLPIYVASGLSSYANGTQLWRQAKEILAPLGSELITKEDLLAPQPPAHAAGQAADAGHWKSSTAPGNGAMGQPDTNQQRQQRRLADTDALPLEPGDLDSEQQAAADLLVLERASLFVGLGKSSMSVFVQERRRLAGMPQHTSALVGQVNSILQNGAIIVPAAAARVRERRRTRR